MAKKENAGGSTVSLTIFGAEFSICAEICTEGESAITFGFTTTGYVCTMNVADVAPAWTTVLSGTAAIAGLLLLKVTFTPAEGAGAFRASVPVNHRTPRHAVRIESNAADLLNRESLYRCCIYLRWMFWSAAAAG